MLSEQTLLNAAVLTVDATSSNRALAGIVFNVLLIARAPLQLFQAIQTSLLPHLTGLEATEGHEAFARAIRVTVLAIAAFAAAVALGLLAIGPFVMDHLFGQHYAYNRFGLALIGLGMGMHLTSGALNQAALARDRARTAAVCWADRGGRLRRLDVRARRQRRTAAHRDRLSRRDEPARADAQRRLPARRTGRSALSAGGRGDRAVGLAGSARRRSPSPRRTRSRPPAGSRARSRDRSRRRPPPPRRAPTIARTRSIFSGECAMNGCPPQPGLTVMHSAMSIAPATSASAPDRGRGVDRHAHARPAARGCRSGGVGDVRRGLGVERDRVGAGLHELGDVALGALDHQVHVEHRPRRVRLLAQRGHDQRPDRDRRHEVPVHHVHVDHPRAGVAAPPPPARAAGRSRRRGSTAPRARRAAARARTRSYRLAASSRRSCCTSGSRSRTCARSSSARRSSGTPRSARSGAGSTRSGSVPGRFVGRSHGSPQCGQCGPSSTGALGRASRLAGHALSSRRSRAMKKPAVRSRWGSVSTRARARRAMGCREGGQLDAEVIEGEIGVGVQERGDLALVLGRGDRARRVDQHAARTERPRRPPRESRACASASSAKRRALHAPAQIGTRLQRAQARARRVHEHAVEHRPLGPRLRGVGELDAHVVRRAAARAVRTSAPARRRSRSTATTSPAPAHQRGQMRALAAGRGAQVEHALARLGRERAGHEHRRARLRQKRPVAPQRASRGRRMRSSSTSASGSPRVGRACAPAARAASVGASVMQRVRAQRHLAGLVVAGHQRARVARRRAPATTGARSTPGASA